MSLPENPIALVIILTAVVCAALITLTGTLQLWLFARFAKEPVPLIKIISMKMRWTAGRVVSAYITVRKAGLPIELEELEALYLSDPKAFEKRVIAIVKEAPKQPNQSPSQRGQPSVGDRSPRT